MGHPKHKEGCTCSACAVHKLDCTCPRCRYQTRGAESQKGARQRLRIRLEDKTHDFIEGRGGHEFVRRLLETLQQDLKLQTQVDKAMKAALKAAS